MESVKQIKLAAYVFACLMLFSLLSCRTPPAPPPLQPLILQEMTPLPRAVVVQAPAPEFEHEPIFTVLRIVEVSEVNGVQRFFMVRMGADRTGIYAGATGEISDDENFNRIIGTFRILELQGMFFRSEITELTHRIGSNAHVRIQTGEIIREVQR